MLTRKNRAELVTLLTSLLDVLLCMEWERAELAAATEVLVAIDSALKNNLTSEEYRPIADINAGLINIIQDTAWDKLSASDRAKSAELCCDIVTCVRDMVAALPTRKIIFFLPYQASMWDSLASVWEAARADSERAEVHVVPLPYAERNPDGTAREWHCDLAKMPQATCAERYQDYLIEALRALHPDVIFIHNAYDDRNSVTSVDSSYYSDRLRECCDTLVYIPYFNSANNILTARCQLAGVVNADYVIVQNEKLKEQYEQNYPAPVVPVGKFLPLGSPKLDRVLTARRADYQLPPSWARIISGRRVVLYNTSIAAALDNVATFCTKLRSVLRFFRDSSLALWWRPHPLLAASLAARYPDCCREYEQIVREYRASGWGIYDDTADLDRAIACTDLYYGDASSVLGLYEATGKSIVRQYMTEPTPVPLSRVAVWSLAFTQVGETLYFIHGRLNALFSYDTATSRLRYITRLGSGPMNIFDGYIALLPVGARVYAIPAVGTDIICYDSATDGAHVVPIPRSQVVSDDGRLFNTAQVIGRYIYVFPTYATSLIRIDTTSEQVEVMLDLRELFSASGIDPHTELSYSRVVGDEIIMPLYDTNVLFAYNYTNNSCRFIRLGEHRYGTIAISAKYIYLGGVLDDPTILCLHRDFSYSHELATANCALRDYAADGVIGHDERTGTRAIFYDDGPVVELDPGQRTRECQADIGHRLMTDGASGRYIFDGHRGAIIAKDGTEEIILDLAQAEGIERLHLSGQQVYDESPFIDLTELAAQKSTPQALEPCGERIYHYIVAQTDRQQRKENNG